MEIGDLWNRSLGIVVLLVGGGMFLWQGLNLWEALRSRSWPRARGRVLESVVDRRDGSDGLGYLLRVVCQYKVGESNYTCDRLRFGPRFRSFRKQPVARASIKYAVGGDVEVSYDPERPERAVLEPGFSPRMLWGFLYASVFFTLGILILK